MRLTPLGRRLTLTALLLTGAGYALGYPAFVLLGVGALAVLAVAAVTLAARPKVELSREVFPDRVTRGEPAVGLLTARSTARRRSATVTVWDRHELGGRQGRIAVPLPQLPAQGVTESGYPIPTDRRGTARLGPLDTRISDPFGLLVRDGQAADRQTLLIHPRTHPFDLLAASRSMDREGGGAETVLDGSVTFHRLREYVPGDDLRSVHWRSSARANKLMVRQNVDVTRPEVTVVLVTDQAAYPDPEMFEEAVEAAASVLMSTGDTQIPARLVTGETMTTGRGGPRDIRAALDELAAVEVADDGGLPRIADRMRGVRSRGLLVIACGETTEADLAAARRLAVGHRPALVGRFRRTAGDEPAAEGPALTVIDTALAADFCRRWQRHAAAAL